MTRDFKLVAIGVGLGVLLASHLASTPTQAAPPAKPALCKPDLLYVWPEDTCPADHPSSIHTLGMRLKLCVGAN